MIRSAVYKKKAGKAVDKVRKEEEEAEEEEEECRSNFYW